MTPEQRALVADAISVYKQIRADIPAALPVWPLGLPGWTDPWIALGLRGREKTCATVWRRPAEESAAEQMLPMPHLLGHDVDVSVLFPHGTKAAIDRSAERGELAVHLPEAGTACLIAMDWKP